MFPGDEGSNISCILGIFRGCCYKCVYREWECMNSGMDYWTGILEWTTGLAYFWFLHIFGWLKLILTGYKYSQRIDNPSQNGKISSTKPSLTCSMLFVHSSLPLYMKQY